MTPPATVPSPTALDADEVHLWHAALEAPAEAIAAAHRLLSRDESARAARFMFDRDRHRFILARAQLRMILSAYAGVAAAELVFRYGVNGKPELDGPGPHFNLSHSGNNALIAVAPAPVGVDIEGMRTVRDARAIAERFFSPAERDVLRTVSDDGLAEAFYTVWTRKEAFIKASGEGFSTALDSFDVSLDEPARILAVNGDAEQGAAWSVFGLRPSPGTIGAVVLPHGPWRLCIRRFIPFT